MATFTFEEASAPAKTFTFEEATKADDLRRQMASARRGGMAASALLGLASGAEAATEAITPQAILNLPGRIGNAILPGPDAPDVFQSNTPAINLPQATEIREGIVPQTAAGIYNTLAQVASGFTTPENIVTLPAAGPSATVRALFAGQMANELPAMAGEASVAVQDPNLPLNEKVSAVGHPVVTAAMVTGLAGHQEVSAAAQAVREVVNTARARGELARQLREAPLARSFTFEEAQQPIAIEGQRAVAPEGLARYDREWPAGVASSGEIRQAREPLPGELDYGTGGEMPRTPGLNFPATETTLKPNPAAPATDAATTKPAAARPVAGETTNPISAKGKFGNPLQGMTREQYIETETRRWGTTPEEEGRAYDELVNKQSSTAASEPPAPVPPAAAAPAAPAEQSISATALHKAVMNSVMEGGMIEGLKKGRGKEGHYVVVPPEFAEDSPMALGPFVDAEAARTFMESEVGAAGARVVQVVKNGKKYEESEIPQPPPAASELPKLVKADVKADPRLDEPGITRNSIPNRLILQMRDLESRPIGEIDVPATGDPLVDSKTAEALIRKHATQGVSLRESNVTSTGKNGRAIYRYTITPNGIAWAEAAKLVEARKSNTARPGDASEATRAEQPPQPGGNTTLPQTPPAVKTARGVTGLARFIREEEHVGHDILSFITHDMGGMLSKSAARKEWGKEKFDRNKSEWDDAPGKLASVHHNVIFRGRMSPSTMAQAAFDAGKIDAPTATALWEAVDRASKARAGTVADVKKQAAILKAEVEEHQNWVKATAAGKEAITPDELIVGDVLMVEGERAKVVEKDPDTGDVIIQDGRRFGRQKLESGETYYVEAVEGVEGRGDPTDFFAGEDVGEPFSLGQPETVAEQNARLAAEAQAAAAKAQAANAAETLRAQAQAKLGGDLGSAGQGGLFAEPGTVEMFQPPAPGKGPGIIGMGGAIPAEFQHSAQTPTGIKNAVVDAERAKRGLPPAMRAAKRTFGEVWDEAMARVDQDPDITVRLVDELATKPRAVTDLEDALLLHRQIDLQNEYGKFTRELAQAYDDAQSFPNRLEAVEDLKVRVQETSDKLQTLYDVNRAVGTATGRGLAARKMMAFEDYSLAQMEVEKRAANEGRPLTDTERAELVKLQTKIAETQKAFDDYQAKVELERANRMTDEAIADMQAELKRRPNYDPRIVKIAEEIVTKLEQQAGKSMAALKSAVWSVNPEVVYHLGVIGAAKIARHGLDFTKFSAEMLAEFGDRVQPYLQAVWEKANLHLDNEGAKYGDKAPQVKNLLRKRDEGSRRENVVAGLKKAQAEGIPPSLAGDYVRKLAESFVRAGVDTREALIDAVHEVLTKEIGMDLTRRETMDAISGYGRFKPLNPDAIKAQLRDLRGQMQQVAKLEDIQSRQPLKKTGVQRRIPSDEERRLVQQVNEAKRRFGVVVSDPARQLKSALDAIKTRLQNQIADLEFQINTGERIVKTKTPSPTDAQTQLLELRRDALRAQLDELLPKPELTDAQRAAIAARGLERSIADLETRIKAGDVSVRSARPAISTPQLEALRARRDALRQELQLLADAADPARRDRVALQALKSRLATATATYQERLARGDFAPRQRRQVTLDAEALKLKAAHEMAKAEFHRGLIRDRMANASAGQKVWRGVKEALNLPRNIMASWDVSAVLRQGGFIALGNPARAAQSLAPMFRSLASERAAVMVEQEILSRPNAPVYRQAKLYLAPHESLHLSAMEEAMMSRLAGKIPGLRASNRAYITFLNKLRADSFDALKESIESRGAPLNQVELEAIANYINVATGRGNLYKFTPAAEALATAFFAPRLVASRFQLLAGQPLYHGTGRTRQAVAREYAKFLTGAGVVLGLGALAGATIEDDPRSADFGKLRFDNTRVDLMGGLLQGTVLLSRVAAGETKTIKGEVQPIRGNVPYGHSSAADVIARFLRTKLSPIIGTTVDIASGQNVVGEPVTAGSVARNSLIPLSMQDIYGAMQDLGVAKGSALAVLSLFGAGLQHVDNTQAPESVLTAEAMRRVQNVSPELRAKLRAAMETSIRQRMLADPGYSNNIVDAAAMLRAVSESRRTNQLQRVLQP